MLFQTSSRSVAKGERVQEKFLHSPSLLREHRAVIPVVRASPICKSAWGGDTSASLWIRFYLKNNPQPQENPLHRATLKAFTL